MKSCYIYLSFSWKPLLHMLSISNEPITYFASKQSIAMFVPHSPSFHYPSECRLVCECRSNAAKYMPYVWLCIVIFQSYILYRPCVADIFRPNHSDHSINIIEIWKWCKAPNNFVSFIVYTLTLTTLLDFESYMIADM